MREIPSAAIPCNPRSHSSPAAIARHLEEAVDRVRPREHKTLRAAGDDRLAGTRYDWLRYPAAMEPKDRQAFAVLRKRNLKTARAWALKETGMALFEYHYERPAGSISAGGTAGRCAAG